MKFVFLFRIYFIVSNYSASLTISDDMSTLD